MAIDLGNVPVGTPPTTGQKTQMRSSLGLGTSAVEAASAFATAAQGATADTALQPSDVGTAAAQDVGVLAGNVVQLDGSARLPAVDGSQLTGIAGGGDVNGPASSVNGSIATFSGTSGKILQDSGSSVSDFATAAQGTLADSATQPGDLATVATTGDYADLSSLPTLGTAAATASTDYATAAQGATADTATQPADLTAALSAISIQSKSADYPIILTDAGTALLHPSADTTPRTFTIPANGSIAFPVGSVLTFINQDSGGDITIAITSDTMRMAGAGTTGSRTLAANGIATATKLTSAEWIISGTGLT